MKIRQVILCENLKQTQSLSSTNNDNTIIITNPMGHIVNKEQDMQYVLKKTKSPIKEVKVGKICNCCGEMKLFSSYFKRAKGSKDGYRAQCKICYKLKH